MADSTQALQEAIRGFVARKGMTRTQFGEAALGNPGFLPSLTRSRSPRLDTADRVLAFLGKAPVGPAFRHEVEVFLAATRTKASVLGFHAAGNPSFVTRLRQGASPRLATVDRVRAWMAAQGDAAEAEAIHAAAKGGAAPSSPIHRSGETSMDETTSRYLSTQEAAAFLGLSPRTLDRYRVAGTGPPFHKFGNRVRYAQRDLETWAAGQRRFSTSDEPVALRGAA